jgi:hypothetical protein
MRNGPAAQAVVKEGQAKEAALKDVARDQAPEVIDQVRELLFGQEKRRTEQTLASLQAEMHKSFSDMRSELQHQVDALTNRILDLERAGEKRRLEAISDIGRAISELGAAIQNMGVEKPRR